jgi:uncharacterized membrane protein YphA (DoxX/SURF4 family)
MAVAEATHPKSTAGTARIRPFVGGLGGVLLGLVLLVAAGAKALDPVAFGSELARLGLAGPLPPMAVALVALAIEAGLGALLLANLRRTPVLIAATLLVAFFLAISGWSAWRAVHGDPDAGSSCGCFGNLVERTPAEALRQDLAMLVPALALSWIGRPGRRRRVAFAAGVAMATAGVVVGFAAAAPRLPIDDWATRLGPGTRLAALCAGTGAERVCLTDVAPELAAGNHLVVLADAGPGFEQLAAPLNDYARSGAEPPLSVLSEVTPDRRQELYWTVAPAFELHDVPRAILRPLYRSLPRSFRVEDGVVTETWNGLPPGVGDAAKGKNHR